jgi:hypothetical protein
VAFTSIEDASYFEVHGESKLALARTAEIPASFEALARFEEESGRTFQIDPRCRIAALSWTFMIASRSGKVGGESRTVAEAP